METKENRITIIDESDIETVLSRDVEFEGALSFDRGLSIKGKFTGNIRSSGSLFVEETADVKADIFAGFVSIKGRVEGNIRALTRVEIFSRAHVEGDITAPDILMESGCRFDGKCTMKKPQEDGTK